MKPDDFAIATRPVNGIVINSVGIINSICEKGVQVYFIGRNEVVIAPFDSISVIDIGQTGDQHPNKICNVCHILKPTTEFSRNQNQAGGRPIRRPSCQECRKKIDGERMPTSERRKMNARRPSDKTVFICPICEKRTIVDITAKIVADHDHDTGAGREWICDSCNTGLGRFKDNITILETAIKYLKRFEDDESEDTDSK
ncbi:MAG: Hpy99I family type II restriction endonuclease [Candidatus Poribacteria bacterium]|nr:Hpy99I family type II restriction endonuclease [Candidatus Poribacteria bacterium]